VSINLTNDPTCERIAGQVTDPFPWDIAPRHLIRDRDGALGPPYSCRIRAMGIRDQSATHARRGRTATLSGSSDRYVVNLDHLIVLGEAHLRGVLSLRFVLQ